MATALSPLRRAVAARWSSGSRRVSRARCSRGGPSSSGRATARAAAELALDESESSLAIHLTVALVDVGVISGAAVRVCAVAVALNLARGLFSVLVYDSNAHNANSLTEQL